MPRDPADRLEDDLDRFYGQLDAEVQDLTEVLGGRLKCRVGCCACCVEGLTVFEVEAEHIQRYFGALLENGLPYPEGACACLDETGACRIYEHRPYVCRTQGLPLRWIDEDQEGEYCEMRDVCPVNEIDCDVLELDAGECWTIGPFEERLSRLQLSLKGGSHRRIPLRSLFRLQR